MVEEVIWSGSWFLGEASCRMISKFDSGIIVWAILLRIWIVTESLVSSSRFCFVLQDVYLVFFLRVIGRNFCYLLEGG